MGNKVQPDKIPKKVVTISLTVHLLQGLDFLAKYGINSRSEAIRNAVDFFLQRGR